MFSTATKNYLDDLMPALRVIWPCSGWSLEETEEGKPYVVITMPSATHTTFVEYVTLEPLSSGYRLYSSRSDREFLGPCPRLLLQEIPDFFNLIASRLPGVTETKPRRARLRLVHV